MGLTWRDGVTAVFMAAIAVIYAAFLGGTSAWLISSARGTTTAVLVLGMVGGCAIGAAGDLDTGSQRRPARVLRAVATTLGLAALTAGIIGLITGSPVALAVLWRPRSRSGWSRPHGTRSPPGRAPHSTATSTRSSGRRIRRSTSGPATRGRGHGSRPAAR